MKALQKIIISGGGTGGHIFPAVSIANELKHRLDNPEILFVGALGRMEMERVPKEGYPIIGLPVAGLHRKKLYLNFKVLYQLWKSMRLARKVIKDFKPDIAIGVGGYASGPLLRVANQLHIPTLLQEQNSYAGLTNRWLSKKASKICVAYEGMERFFPSDKIVLTGNPIRQNLENDTISRTQAILSFNLDPSKKVVLILGGSLGARTINNSVIKHLDLIAQGEVQFIWQTGKLYFEKAQQELKKTTSSNIFVSDFITSMDYAYKAADLVISRAGAGTISELCNLCLPCILVPSPNVSEDHQTQNALALVQKKAAIMIKDIDAETVLITTALEIVNNEPQRIELKTNIATFALPNAAEKIATEVINIIKEK